MLFHMLKDTASCKPFSLMYVLQKEEKKRDTKVKPEPFSEYNLITKNDRRPTTSADKQLKTRMLKTHLGSNILEGQYTFFTLCTWFK